MGWKLLAAASLALFVLSALVYWLGAGSAYSVRLGDGADVLANSPNGEAVVIAKYNELRLYDATGSPHWSRALDADACSISFSPDGERVAVFAGDRLYFLSATDGSIIKEVSLPLSCAPSSFIYWSPGGGAVLLNARGRVAYVTIAGRGEVSPYVGLMVTGVSWVSDTEALLIDGYGRTVYSFSVPPLTVDFVASYGESGAASIVDGRVFIISSKGWVALVDFGGVAYNISLGSPVRASAISGLGFAVVGDEVLAIDPSTGAVLWRHPVAGGEGAILKLEACGDAAAIISSAPIDNAAVMRTQILLDGEDVLKGLFPVNGTAFLGWFPECSSALVYSGGETYIVDVRNRKTVKLDGILLPVASVGDSLVVMKFRNRLSGAVPYLLSSDGTMKPLVKLGYSYVRTINNETLIVLDSNGAWLVRVGSPPPSTSWAWLAPAAVGAALAVLAVRAFLKERSRVGG